MVRFVSILLLITLSTLVSAYELVSVQAISTTRRSFITRKGKIHGIAVGQQATFTTDNVSVLAIAEEVTGEYTLWKIADPEGTVPFRRSELVSFNASGNSIWYNLVPYQEKKSERPWLITLKGTFAEALEESVSDIQDDDKAQRQGQQFGAYLLIPFDEGFYFGAGIRADEDGSSGRSISYSSSRLLGIAVAEYHFPRFSGYNAHLYAGIHLGLGKSLTQIAGIDVAGTVLVMPVVKVGVETELNRFANIFLETSFESMVIRDQIATNNQVTTQKSTIINGKISVGLNFRL
jgi:hypothetical protein